LEVSARVYFFSFLYLFEGAKGSMDGRKAHWQGDAQDGVWMLVRYPAFFSFVVVVARPVSHLVLGMSSIYRICMARSIFSSIKHIVII
jgi:hypothetical protein